MKGKQAHLNAHVDHSYFVSKNVMITTAWVRDNSSIQIKTTLHSGGGEVITKSIKSFNFIRPDVNKHFNDSDEVKSGIFYIFEIESDFEKTDLTIKISLGGVEKELNANITDDAKSVMTALSLMESIEFEELNNSLLKKYSSLLILQADGKKMGPETLPGSLKIEIEHAFSITGYGVFLQGWLIDADSNLAGIHIKQGSHVSNNLLESSTRFVRPDVNSLFPQYISSQCSAGLFGIAVNNQFINGLNYELIMVTRTGDITTQVLEVITKSGDTVELIRSLLTPLDLTKARYQEELSGYLGEAIAYIWKNKALPKQAVEIIEYGSQVDKPLCSIIIPIYGRYDFVLYQMTQFDTDAFMKNVEVIFVLDDPKIHSEFNAYCISTSPLSSLGFKTVYGGSNRGYAGANNLGVAHASADKILLLNSDVMPKYNNWLADLLSVFEKQKKIGILGARLLFEDETIQHDGLKYHKLPSFQNLWLIDHPGKGLPEWLTTNNQVRKVSSVTGACMLMKKATYQELGGLDECYVLGDFEDSDLCLKALKAGYENYIDSSTSLYHLERQSQNLFNDTSWKFKLTIYNGLQHAKRWNSSIVKLLAQGNE
jgi:GT2 family glycosyltransferase